MNQTRVFLLIAWLLVATLLWMEWNKEHTAAALQAAPVATQAAASNGAVPGAVPNAPTGTTAAGVPAAPAQAGVPSAATPAQHKDAVTVTTDTLRVTLDGGNVLSADLLKFPADAKSADAGNVTLFDPDPARFYEAQSGWVSNTGPAPDHLGAWVPERNARNVTLAAGQDAVAVPFTWTGANGVTIRRTYTFPRGGYAIGVRDEVINNGASNWQGYVYRQLVRNPPPQKTGYTNPEAFAFHGATWYTPAEKYDRRKYEDFVDDGTLDKDSTGGWIALLQHYFFSAWIPGDKDASKFTLSTTQDAGVTHYVVRAFAKTPLVVAPGQKAETNARLWVGPKLVSAIEAQNVPGLTRAVDFSRFSIMATLAGWLFFVLSAIHSVVGNWGWSIIGLVILVRALLYPIAAKQFQSMAKMRKLAPRMQQLKERYGDDRQKLQMATMELYKKEKVNPAAGCLPLLIQMPIFLALYWMLSESVELRHAPWALWIDNLSARDPFFILPIINVAIMWATQRLTPMAGMDPAQQKMMQFMPLVIGVTMIFFPAGLVLYWVTNGALGLLQQWWMLKRFGEQAPAKA